MAADAVISSSYTAGISEMAALSAGGPLWALGDVCSGLVAEHGALPPAEALLAPYSVRGGASAAVWTTSAPWLDFVISCDPLVVVAELISVSAVVAVTASRLGWARVSGYDDVVTFMQRAAVSVTEVAVVTTLALALVLFDAFAAVTEEDLVDVAAALILALVGLTFLLLLLAVDVQYYFMVSAVSGGDVSLRVIGGDIVNNALCALRIVFCWARYILYDLQVEFVDLSFHYTDVLGGSVLEAAAPRPTTDSGGWLAAFGTWALFVVSVQADVVLLIVQALTGLFKLAIASFLLWLIIDLFILRPFARTESRGLRLVRRNR